MVEGSGFENRRARKGSRGSNPFSSVQERSNVKQPTSLPPQPFGDEPTTARACRRCGSDVPAERYQAEHLVTWIWRCPCGWASARTESGVVDRRRAHDAIARALSRLEKAQSPSKPED